MTSILVPRIKIFQQANYKDIELEFDKWIAERLKNVEGKKGESIEMLDLPANTQIRWEQGLQKYILTVVYRDYFIPPQQP